MSIDTSPKRLRELADWLQDHGFLGTPEILRATADEKEAAEKQGPVGLLNVSKFRGHLENHDFEYAGKLPDGQYPLYLAPQPVAEKETQVSTADVPLPPLTFEVTVIDDEHPDGIPLSQWIKPADVPLPEPMFYSGTKPVAWTEQQMCQYGQDRAKAARDAAFDECARVCEAVHADTACQQSLALHCAEQIQAAKKGAT